MPKLLRAILWPFPLQTIRNAGEEYLRRRTILWTPWFRIYLHEILRSDMDRALHDHPWAFWSLILRGGYIEETPLGGWSRRPGHLIRHKAEDLHRIELHKNSDGSFRTAWTLVVCGRKTRTWGFETDGGWTAWDEYLVEK